MLACALKTTTYTTMKKTILSFAIAGAAVLGVQSCDKIKEQAFQAFVTNQFEQEVVIPITPAGYQGAFDSVAIEMDINQIIKDNTGGALSIDDIGTVTPEETILTLENADDQNNLANFQQVAVAAWSSKPGANAIAFGTSEVPDAYATEIRLEHAGSVNLKEYANGHKVIYITSLDARRATAKELRGKLKVKFKIDK